VVHVNGAADHSFRRTPTPLSLSPAAGDPATPAAFILSFAWYARSPEKCWYSGEVELGRQVSPTLDEAPYLAGYARELSNIRAALGWYFHSSDPEASIPLLLRSHDFYWMHGPCSEGWSWRRAYLPVIDRLTVPLPARIFSLITFGDRFEHEQTLAGLQAALAGDQLTAELTRGRAWTLDQAVALARDSLPC
jgi:hypothetical protein